MASKERSSKVASSLKPDGVGVRCRTIIRWLHRRYAEAIITKSHTCKAEVALKAGIGGLRRVGRLQVPHSPIDGGRKTAITQGQITPGLDILGKQCGIDGCAIGSRPGPEVAASLVPHGFNETPSMV